MGSSTDGRSLDTEVSLERATSLFDEACGLDSSQRTAWLLTQCAGDSALLADVLSLVAAADAESVANRAASKPIAGTGSVVGQRFGPWAVIRLLGTGGMGSVLLVERADCRASGIV